MSGQIGAIVPGMMTVEAIAKIPGASPSASHDSWLKEKVETGWVYGETKDPEKKTHPCCVPYEQLPIEQRRKDYIFGAIVRACLAAQESP